MAGSRCCRAPRAGKHADAAVVDVFRGAHTLRTNWCGPVEQPGLRCSPVRGAAVGSRSQPQRLSLLPPPLPPLRPPPALLLPRVLCSPLETQGESPQGSLSSDSWPLPRALRCARRRASSVPNACSFQRCCWCARWCGPRGCGARARPRSWARRKRARAHFLRAAFHAEGEASVWGCVSSASRTSAQAPASAMYACMQTYGTDSRKRARLYCVDPVPDRIGVHFVYSLWPLVDQCVGGAALKAQHLLQGPASPLGCERGGRPVTDSRGRAERLHLLKHRDAQQEPLTVVVPSNPRVRAPAHGRLLIVCDSALKGCGLPPCRAGRSARTSFSNATQSGGFVSARMHERLHTWMLRAFDRLDRWVAAAVGRPALLIRQGAYCPHDARCMHAHIRPVMHAFKRAWIRAVSHACKRARIRAVMHACMCACTGAVMHACTRARFRAVMHASCM
eukprot:362520-Chlamydomonas_euryale.AAC.3